MVPPRLIPPSWGWLHHSLQVLLTTARTAFARLRRHRPQPPPPPDLPEPLVTTHITGDVATVIASPGPPPPELTTGRAASILQATTRRGVTITTRLTEHRHAAPAPHREHLLHLRHHVRIETPE